MCVVCAGSDWERLPDPSPAASLLSDFREIAEPLMKSSCLRCGCAQRASSEVPLAYEEYALYSHPAGTPFEARRQNEYAAWFSAVLDRPESVFEAGSGNGSLLLAMREAWPTADLRGREPSAAAVAFAVASGVEVEAGFLDAATVPNRTSDLALSVNVLEHVAEPAGFLAGLARHSAGQVAVVCPNGDLPSVELLFADHLHSFTRANMEVLFANAGIEVLEQHDAPAAIGAFVLTVGRRARAAARERAPNVDAMAQRKAYLEAWRGLDRTLLGRIGAGSVVCFGTGEAAALLRTYAPETWARVDSCTVDHVDAGTFAGKPVVPYAAAPQRTILLGTRPGVQRVLAARLESDGHRVVAWDDIIAA